MSDDIYQTLDSVATGEKSINEFLLENRNVLDDMVLAMQIVMKYRPESNQTSNNLRTHYDNYTQIQRDMMGLAAYNVKIGTLAGMLKAASDSIDARVKFEKAKAAARIKNSWRSDQGRITDKAVTDMVLIEINDFIKESYVTLSKYEMVINTYKSINDMINALKLQTRVLEEEKKRG